MLGLIPVRRCASMRQARQLGLVLTAQGIPSRIVPLGDGVALCVKEADRDAAEAELAAYEAENAPPATPPRPWRPRDGGVETALAYVTLLVFVFAAEGRGAFGWDWAAIGAARAGEIAGGALWRTVTALTLHADLEHLLSNVAFGGVAGALVVQALGPGVAWLAILAAGALGNLVNAVVLQDAGHVSVGASTAVFGALGLLSGHTQRRTATGEPWRVGLRRWAPAAAGVLLLAFLGFGGERTDVGAHVAGFAVGLGLGFALDRLPEPWLRARWQWTAGALSVATVALAWSVAAVSA